MVTDFPLADILHNRDAMGRISKWAVELGALSINFKPRTAIKSQALVNFLAEWQENQVPALATILEHWVMYFDDSLKLEGRDAGVLLLSPKGEQLKYVLAVLSLTEIIRKRMDTNVAFTLEYSRVSNPQGTRSVLVVALVYPRDMTVVKRSR